MMGLFLVIFNYIAFFLLVQAGVRSLCACYPSFLSDCLFFSLPVCLPLLPVCLSVPKLMEIGP